MVHCWNRNCTYEHVRFIFWRRPTPQSTSIDGIVVQTCGCGFVSVKHIGSNSNFPYLVYIGNDVSQPKNHLNDKISTSISTAACIFQGGHCSVRLQDIFQPQNPRWQVSNQDSGGPSLEESAQCRNESKQKRGESDWQMEWMNGLWFCVFLLVGLSNLLACI